MSVAAGCSTGSLVVGTNATLLSDQTNDELLPTFANATMFAVARSTKRVLHDGGVSWSQPCDRSRLFDDVLTRWRWLVGPRRGGPEFFRGISGRRDTPPRSGDVLEPR